MRKWRRWELTGSCLDTLCLAIFNRCTQAVSLDSPQVLGVTDTAWQDIAWYVVSVVATIRVLVPLQHRTTEDTMLMNVRSVISSLG